MFKVNVILNIPLKMFLKNDKSIPPQTTIYPPEEVHTQVRYFERKLISNICLWDSIIFPAEPMYARHGVKKNNRN